jgi:hypothetical protein
MYNLYIRGYETASIIYTVELGANKLTIGRAVAYREYAEPEDYVKFVTIDKPSIRFCQYLLSQPVAFFSSWINILTALFLLFSGSSNSLPRERRAHRSLLPVYLMS